MQETHLRTSDVSNIKSAWISHCFHSKFGVKARGAAILVHKNTALNQNQWSSDPNGRYVIVSGILQTIPVVLACIYGPNWDNDTCFAHFFSVLPNLDSHHIVIGGDFNLVQNTILDRSSSNSPHCPTLPDFSSQVKSSHLYLYSAFNIQIVSKQLHNIKMGNSVNNVK